MQNTMVREGGGGGWESKKYRFRRENEKGDKKTRKIYIKKGKKALKMHIFDPTDETLFGGGK